MCPATSCGTDLVYNRTKQSGVKHWGSEKWNGLSSHMKAKTKIRRYLTPLESTRDSDALTNVSIQNFRLSVCFNKAEASRLKATGMVAKEVSGRKRKRVTEFAQRAIADLRAQLDKELVAAKERHEKDLAAVRADFEHSAVTAKNSLNAVVRDKNSYFEQAQIRQIPPPVVTESERRIAASTPGARGLDRSLERKILRTIGTATQPKAQDHGLADNLKLEISSLQQQIKMSQNENFELILVLRGQIAQLKDNEGSSTSMANILSFSASDSHYPKNKSVLHAVKAKSMKVIREGILYWRKQCLNDISTTST
ncbi:hypothetical protein F5050DRAFT_1875598 [Lentinula boryana]|uniref:Uncharacterized protein n=1 Tax=Lentinula boryana TaxID=40481 RepID=A0ABQ8Q041_9AGAR|nr:hypothetical protein F5050DRAFT_1875598 [Lentinula boryana]